MYKLRHTYPLTHTHLLRTIPAPPLPEGAQPWEGDWRDPKGGFYGGAIIRITADSWHPIFEEGKVCSGGAGGGGGGVCGAVVVVRWERGRFDAHRLVQCATLTATLTLTNRKRNHNPNPN